MLKQIFGFFITVVGLIGIFFNPTALISIAIIGVRALILLFQKNWNLGVTFLVLVVLSIFSPWGVAMKVTSAVVLFMGIGMIFSGSSTKGY